MNPHSKPSELMSFAIKIIKQHGSDYIALLKKGLN